MCMKKMTQQTPAYQPCKRNPGVFEKNFEWSRKCLRTGVTLADLIRPRRKS